MSCDSSFILLSLTPEIAGPPPHPPGYVEPAKREKEYVGQGKMAADGTITLQMHIGNTLLTYKTDNPRYESTKKHLEAELGRPMKPGDICACPAF